MDMAEEELEKAAADVSIPRLNSILDAAFGIVAGEMRNSEGTQNAQASIFSEEEGADSENSSFRDWFRFAIICFYR